MCLEPIELNIATSYENAQIFILFIIYKYMYESIDIL